MKKTYYLDLNTLLAYLHNKSGTLTTSFRMSGRSCMGSIALVRGQITSCTAEWSNGHRFEGNQALDQLRSSKEWQVHFDDVPSSSTLIPPSQSQPLPSVLADGSFVPQPRSPLFFKLLTGYTAEQREVLRKVHALVDGCRTVDQMKARLSLASETVDRTLEVLRKIGAIR